MPALFPLLRHHAMDASLFAGESGPVSAGAFLADVAALSARLPDAAYLVNLCTDRYQFVVGFAAAMIRRQVTLLPADAAPGTLAALASRYSDLYCLHDRPIVQTGIAALAFPGDLAGAVPDAIPEFPTGQIAAILFTSGSTGEPAPNPRSWGALVASTRAAAAALGIERGGHLVGTVPHQHSYGLESAVMLPLQHGMALERARPLLPADLLRRLERMPTPRTLITTPVHLRSLVAGDEAVPAVDRIVSATAPLSLDLALRAEARFKAPLFDIYGCSEVGQIAVRRTVETLEWTAIDGIDLRQHDGETYASGTAAGVEATLADVIELRGGGRFLLHGRKADMVNIAGKRGSLAALNHHLNAIDGVLDGVFLAPPDDSGIGRLTAYVVAPGLSATDVITALRHHIDPAFLPRPIRFVDALPRNALGKLTRQAIERLPLEPVER